MPEALGMVRGLVDGAPGRMLARNEGPLALDLLVGATRRRSARHDAGVANGSD